MKRTSYTAIALALALAVATGSYIADKNGGSPLISSAQAQPAPSPCTFPTAPAATPEQTAWQLFVAANCPSNGSKVAWENWIEQDDLYPASGEMSPVEVAALARTTPKRLHGSVLASVLAPSPTKANLLFLSPNTQCNAMNGPPSNVVPNAQICEEARLSPQAANFVTDNGYQIRPGQTAAAQAGKDIEFPAPAVEVKVDWIPAASFKTPFTCAKPPAGVHVETIDGVCYAMAGMHISSKLLTNWLWATFESQSMLTNPLRCMTFGPCSDPWGSVPATSGGGAGGFTQQSPALQALMKQANLAPEFSNYRLDGAQVNFMEPDGKTDSYLGNSVIEGENVGMTKNTASCITCHSVSSIKNDGTDGIKLLGPAGKAGKLVGPQYKFDPGWIARDFVWSMDFACPGRPRCTVAANAPTKAGKK